MTKCKGCDIAFEKNTSKQIFCSRTCQVKFNGSKNNKERSNKYYSKLGPFLTHLLQLASYKREALSKEFLLNLFYEQEGMCAITGQPMTHIRGQGRVNTNISIDRIDSTKGYTEDNVQLVCRIVNTMKLDMTDEEFKFWCSLVLNPRNSKAGKK